MLSSVSPSAILPFSFLFFAFLSLSWFDMQRVFNTPHVFNCPGYVLSSVPFHMREWNNHSYVVRFHALTKSGEVTLIYSAYDDVKQNIILGARVFCGVHWARRATHLQNEYIRYASILFVCCVENYRYVERMSSVMNQCFLLPGHEPSGYRWTYSIWHQHFV